MRTILIPTDFTSTPLLLLKHAALALPDKLDVIFLYSTFVSDSITDLLFYSPQKILQVAVSKEFQEGCSIMQNKYPEKITRIRFELFHGTNANAFRIFAEQNRIDKVFVAHDHPYRLRGSEFNPTKLILKSEVAVEEVTLQLNTRMAEKDLIAQLLTS